MTDDELLNNCVTRQAQEGASSLKCGFPIPGEPQWAWGCFLLSRNCLILPHKVLLRLLSAGWGAFPWLLPFRAAVYRACFWQELGLNGCARKERLEGRRQNQTAHPRGASASQIWPLVFLACEFSFQPRSASKQGMKLNF